MGRAAPLLIGLAILVTACGGAPTASDNAGVDRSAEVYAEVIRRLVIKDHTFGAGSSPFQRIFIVDGVVDDAAAPTGKPRATERFNAAVRDEIARRLAGLPPVDFVTEPGSALVGGDGCTVKDHGALISLGPIEGGGDRVTVANGLFFACLGGQWQTYVLERVNRHWSVQGTTGPIAIS